MKNRDSGKAKSGKAKREEVTMEEYLAAKAELDAVREEYGIRPKEGKISRAISNFFNKRDAKELRTVSRKKYLWLCVLTGWCGGHRFYERRWILGILYLALCWSGFPIAMAMVDFLIALPMKPDENGCILI